MISTLFLQKIQIKIYENFALLIEICLHFKIYIAIIVHIAINITISCCSDFSECRRGHYNIQATDFEYQ